jgi:hypothetical protein
MGMCTRITVALPTGVELYEHRCSWCPPMHPPPPRDCADPFLAPVTAFTLLCSFCIRNALSAHAKQGAFEWRHSFCGWTMALDLIPPQLLCNPSLPLPPPPTHTHTGACMPLLLWKWKFCLCILYVFVFFNTRTHQPKSSAFIHWLQEGDFEWRHSFCAWTMASEQHQVLVVNDALQDARCVLTWIA